MIGTPGIRWCDCRWRFLVNGPISPLNRPLFKFIHFCMRADTKETPDAGTQEYFKSSRNEAAILVRTECALEGDPCQISDLRPLAPEPHDLCFSPSPW